MPGPSKWVRKRVVSLFRDRAIWLQSNSRYLNALARVDDPTPGLRAQDAIPSRKQPLSARPVRAFNPLSRPDRPLFAARMSGEHTLPGFANRDLRGTLTASAFSLHDDPKKGSAQVSRLLHRLHVHGLVAEIPRSRRWRVTACGHSVMRTAVKPQTDGFPKPLSGRIRSPLDARPTSLQNALKL